MASEFINALAEARKFNHEGHYESALFICNKLTISYPNKYQSFELRSSIYRKLNNLDKSISDIDRVITLMPYSASPYFRKGRYLTVMNRVREAVEEFTKAIELDNGYFGDTLYFYRAEGLLQIGDLKGALNDCEHIDAAHTERHFYGHSVRTKNDIERELNARMLTEQN